MDYSALGHPPIKEFVGGDVYSHKRIADGPDYSTEYYVFNIPFIMRGSRAFEKLLSESQEEKGAGPTDAGATTLLDKWCDATVGFAPKVEGASRSTDGVAHALSVGQGVGKVEDALKEIMQGAKFINGLPAQALNALLTRASLFGYSSTYVRRTFEQDYFGSLRMVARGTLRVLLVHPLDLKNVLAGDNGAGFLPLAGGKGVSPAATTTFDKVMSNLDKNTATAWGTAASKCPIWHGTAHEQFLYVPPAWFSCMAVTNGTTAAGFRQLLLPNVERSALTTLRECADGELQESATNCIDILLNAMSSLD